MDWYGRGGDGGQKSTLLRSMEKLAYRVATALIFGDGGNADVDADPDDDDENKDSNEDSMPISPPLGPEKEHIIDRSQARCNLVTA